MQDLQIPSQTAERHVQPHIVGEHQLANVIPNSTELTKKTHSLQDIGCVDTGRSKVGRFRNRGLIREKYGDLFKMCRTNNLSLAVKDTWYAFPIYCVWNDYTEICNPQINYGLR